MPKAFEECRKKKDSKIRTVSGPSKEHNLKKNEYVHYCVVNGESHRGEVKTNQKAKMME